MTKRREIRYIEWVDSAATSSGWSSADDLEDFGVSECQSIGFVLGETDEEVHIVQSIDVRHRNFESVMAIPKVAITKSKTIRPAKC